MNNSFVFNIDFAGEQFPAKKGYDVSGTVFINSFSTEAVTPEQFLEKILKGRAYASAFRKRSAADAGRPDRFTSKVDENFMEATVITLDMDEYQGEGDIIEIIKSDPFFDLYGFAIVHSSSSTPETPKAHVIYILETPVTDPDTYKLILKAMTTSYTWSDKSCIDLLRTNFSAIDPEYYLHGKTLPFQDLWKHKVAPYQKLVHEKEIEMARIRERDLIEWEARPKVNLTKDRLHNYVQAAIDGILDDLAMTTHARNRALTVASYRLAALQNSAWIGDAHVLFSGIEQQLVQACTANGYEQKYGRPNQPGHETIRVYRTCLRGCTDSRREPLWLNTPMNQPTEKAYGDYIPYIVTDKSDDDLQKALEARYLQGYEQGWLDGFVAGLELGGSEIWKALGFSEIKQALYELGWDNDKKRLTIPHFSQDGRLLNVEYHVGGEHGMEISYENNSELGALYQPDTSVTSSSTTLLVPDSMTAIHATYEMAKFSTEAGMDPWMIYAVPASSRIPECSALLSELDTDRVVMVVPLQDSTVDEDQLHAMRSCCKIIRPAATLDKMIQYNDDLGWIERLINMS